MSIGYHSPLPELPSDWEPQEAAEARRQAGYAAQRAQQCGGPATGYDETGRPVWGGHGMPASWWYADGQYAHGAIAAPDGSELERPDFFMHSSEWMPGERSGIKPHAWERYLPLAPLARQALALAAACPDEWQADQLRRAAEVLGEEPPEKGFARRNWSLACDRLRDLVATRDAEIAAAQKAAAEAAQREAARLANSPFAALAALKGRK